MSDMLKRIGAAMTAFTKIGTTNGSAPPALTDNRAPLVYEALIASRLLKAATERKEQAYAALKDAGILNDDYKPGDYAPYTDDVMVVSVKRNKDSETLDKTMLGNELTKAYGKDVADKLIAKASKTRKGNTIISVGVR